MHRESGDPANWHREFRVTSWATGPSIDARRVRSLGKSFAEIVQASRAAASSPKVELVGDGETKWSVTLRAADLHEALAAGLHLARRGAGENRRFVRADAKEIPAGEHLL